MPYNVIVDHPNIGEEGELYIHGLGTFKNGTTTEVSDQQIDLYRAAHAVVNISNPNAEGRVKHLPALGRHPVDLNIYGVRVEKVEDAPDESEKSTGEEEAK
jgi:hypothetical protein